MDPRPRLKRLSETQLEAFFTANRIPEGFHEHFANENTKGDLVTDGYNVFGVFHLSGIKYEFAGGLPKEVQDPTL